MNQWLVRIVAFFIICTIFFFPWIHPGTLSGGDWPYLFPENIKQFSFLPQKEFLWLGPYYQITAKLSIEYLHIPWEIAERLWWFFPIVILAIISGYYLTKSWIGGLIYATNTYIIMIIGGGQMGIAFAYALAPLVVKRLLDAIDAFSLREKGLDKIDIKELFFLGVIFGIFTAFDPRISFIILLVIGLYMVFLLSTQQRKRKSTCLLLYTYCLFLGSIGILTVLINLYWIIPVFLQKGPVDRVLGQGYLSVEGLRFFSFGSFSQALSLIHPNWPENIFGKTYFTRPEFLIIPIVAFSSLFFVQTKQKNKKILFWIWIGLVGVFFAKGTNEPFGQLYEWLFIHVSPFSLFRDPTKWYLLIILSYSILIPFVLDQLHAIFINHKGLKRMLQTLPLFSLVFLIYWGFTIRQALLGQLSGTLPPHPIPQEYRQLKDFIQNDTSFYQTLWIPKKQRYGFSSIQHPALDAQSIFSATDSSGMARIIETRTVRKKIDALQIKYIIVPFDSQGEIFLKDRRYNQQEYEKNISNLEKISWLKREPTFQKNGVFQINTSSTSASVVPLNRDDTIREGN